MFIRKSPQSIRSWWIGLPDEYEAKDPREQPFRIVTVKRLPSGREFLTYWRLPDGSVREMHEILTERPDGSWTFEIPSHPVGFHILDEFRLEPVPNGTNLHIRSTITPREPSAVDRIAAQKERMTQGWKVAAEICERDAP